MRGKQHTHGQSYSENDLSMLKAMWPDYPKADILKKFPTRTWQALQQVAHQLGVKRDPRMIQVARIRANSNAKPLYHELRILRISKKITIGELSTKLGYSRWELQRWEMGHRNPSVFGLEAWGQSLGMELTWKPVSIAEPKREFISTDMMFARSAAE